MKYVCRIIFVLNSLLMSSCGIGGYWMNGVSGKERTEYLNSIKPYGAHWVKEGMTRESRRDDSWACGAARTEPAANGPIFSDEDIALEKSAIDKNDYGPRGRLFDKWGKCMQSKGYAYLEQCDARCLHP